MRKTVPVLCLKPLILALIAGLACLPPASAEVSASGNFFVWPSGPALGPGNTDLGASTLSIGNGAAGSFAVTAGSQFSAASIRFADGGSGSASGLFDGALTKVSLTSDGNSNRLDLGAWGSADLTISGGATLDGRANASACLLGVQWCHNFIGNAAGSTATLTITGAGSNASFLRAFVVGGVSVFRPPIENFTFGTPGGTSSGTVQILDGGLLTTDTALLGVGPGGSSPTGTERSFADVLIDGVGSTWRVTGGTLDATAATVWTATHRNAWAKLTISNGGKLWFDGKDGISSNLQLTSGGGRSDMTITGAGSELLFTGDGDGLNVGRSLGSASLTISAGGKASGLMYVGVGRDGSYGQLLIDGAGSELLANGTASAAASNGVAFNPIMDIGRNGGTGVVTVSNGGKLSLVADQALPGGLQMSLGREANSSGKLTIAGAGSQVLMSSRSVLAGGGPGEALNPLLRVGRDGSGTLIISDGGKLILDGQAVSTAQDSRSTSLFIGGSSDTSNGGKGIASVSGLGSEIRLTGYDTYIGVGHGPQSFGQLSVSDGATVSAIGMNVGRSGGVGVLQVDNASLNFSGQQTGGTLSGAFLAIGRSGGIGVASFDNHSVVTLSNFGSAGASLSLGGTAAGPLGDGTLTVSGGSTVRIQAAPGQATLSVGRDGTALMRVRGGSLIDIGDGSLYVARLKGSDGTLLVSEGSTINAGWVGIGRNKSSDGGSVDGGTATLVLNNSVLNADTIVIGSNGFLGGNGTINGAVTNYGIFSPGNSPGTMTINGDYSAQAGSRLILEVEAGANGSYLTDAVVFGGAVDLTGLQIEFRFLGATDPTAFLHSGQFDIDTFLGRSDGHSGLLGLGDASYASVLFSARAESYVISNFSYSASGGASFSATAVPEPRSWAMMLAGLVGLAACARRQRRGTLV